MKLSFLRPRQSLRAAAVVVAGATLVFSAAAPAMGAAAPSDQDVTFASGNAETSLAEITIAGIALERSDDAQTRELATMTKSDHTAALKKLTAVAEQAGITLPDEPSAAQKADAATLRSVPAAEFDGTYAQIQVAGHQKSVASTNTEISSGQDTTVVAYAQGYLPTASMHLQMAQDLMATLGVTPTAAPAGDGGLAAAATTGSSIPTVVVVLAIALLVLGGVVLLRRRAARS